MQEEGPREAGKSPSLETPKTPFDKGQEQADHSSWMDKMSSFTTSVILNASTHNTLLSLLL